MCFWTSEFHNSSGLIKNWFPHIWGQTIIVLSPNHINEIRQKPFMGKGFPSPCSPLSSYAFCPSPPPHIPASSSSSLPSCILNLSLSYSFTIALPLLLPCSHPPGGISVTFSFLSPVASPSPSQHQSPCSSCHLNSTYWWLHLSKVVSHKVKQVHIDLVKGVSPSFEYYYFS